MSILGNPLTLGGGGAARKYIVKDGVAVNGNLVALGMKSSSSSSFAAVAPPIAYGQKSVTLGWTSSGSGNGAGIVYVDSLIDLTQYSKLFVQGSFLIYLSSGEFSTANLSCNAFTSLGTYQDKNRVFRRTLSGFSGNAIPATWNYTGVFELDLSQISGLGNNLIAFNFAFNAATSRSSVELSNVWLE